MKLTAEKHRQTQSIEPLGDVLPPSPLTDIEVTAIYGSEARIAREAWTQHRRYLAMLAEIPGLEVPLLPHYLEERPVSE